MTFSIQKRMVLDNATVDKLDKLISDVSEAADLYGETYRNAVRRYRRFIRKVSDGAYRDHYYTGSGRDIIPGSTEIYFGEFVD